jgi:hypothetical protein
VIQLRETRAGWDESTRQRQRCGGAIPTQAFEAPAPSDSLVARAQNSLDLSGSPFRPDKPASPVAKSSNVHGSGIGVGGFLGMRRLSMAIVAGQSIKFRVETPFGKENVPLCPRNCGASSIPQYWDFYVGFGCRPSSARDTARDL